VSETFLQIWLVGLAVLSMFLFLFSKIAGYQGLLIIASCFAVLAAVRTFGESLPGALQGIAQIGLAIVVVFFLIRLWQHVKPLE